MERSAVPPGAALVAPSGWSGGTLPGCHGAATRPLLILPSRGLHIGSGFRADGTTKDQVADLQALQTTPMSVTRIKFTETTVDTRRQLSMKRGRARHRSGERALPAHRRNWRPAATDPVGPTHGRAPCRMLQSDPTRPSWPTSSGRPPSWSSCSSRSWGTRSAVPCGCGWASSWRSSSSTSPSTTPTRRYPNGLTLNLRVVSQVAAVTVVIYLTGWGPVLWGAYAFIVLESVARSGSRCVAHHSGLGAWSGWPSV